MAETGLNESVTEFSEVWAAVDGFPDYQVSTHSRVKSFKRC